MGSYCVLFFLGRPSNLIFFLVSCIMASPRLRLLLLLLPVPFLIIIIDNPMFHPRKTATHRRFLRSSSFL
ncbi:hypothetical protein F5B20DRAFT_555421 [Whalleya microplaca]|nr:hypothetical protein F5B20DRAFT_555421 [Whalleya microplaca]